MPESRLIERDPYSRSDCRSIAEVVGFPAGVAAELGLWRCIEQEVRLGCLYTFGTATAVAGVLARRWKAFAPISSTILPEEAV